MERRIHVCHVQSTFQSGGLENGVVNIVNGLDPSRFRSTVICLYERGPLAERVVNPAAEVICLEQPDRLAPELPFRLAALFKRLEPDVVHTRNYAANLYGTLAARIARVPQVVNGEHGLIQLVGMKKMLVSRTIAMAADRVLCVSPGLRNFLHERLLYPAGSVDVILNGVDLDRFRPRPDGAAARRRELGIPADCWLLGMINRFSRIKDNPAMLDLLERVEDIDGRSLHGIIIGDGTHEREFREETRRRGLENRMHLPGFRQDVNELYGMFDIFCLLSTENEGTSNVLLESMASRTPIVTTDIIGNRHLVTHDWNGVLVPPKGEAKLLALEREVVSLLRDAGRRQRLLDNAAEFVAAKFSLQGMIERYMSYYGRLAR